MFLLPVSAEKQGAPGCRILLVISRPRGLFPQYRGGVEVALDAALGGFLELGGVEDDFGDALVGRQLGVEFCEVVLHDFGQRLFVDALVLCLLVVGDHQGAEPAVAHVDHERFEDHVHVVEFVLDLLGVDVLAVAREDHRLRAAADVERAVGVHGSHVARVEPALGVEDFVRIFFVFVVTLHDVFAAHEDFARRMFRVGRIDPHLEQIPEVGAARSGLELVVGGEADKGRAFGHAVADRDREPDLHEERFGLLVHRGAADDEDRDVAAERVHEFLADDRVDGRVDQRNLHRKAHRALFEHRQHLFAVDLFQNHRHAADDRGLDHRHGFDENLRRGDAAQQGDVSAHGQRRQKVECAAVGVGQRQEREGAAPFLEVALPGLGVHRPAGEQHVAREVVHRQHHPLGVARRAGGVVEQDDPVVGDIGVADVVDGESARVLGPVVLEDVALELGQRLAVAFVDDVEVRERENRFDLAYLLFFDDVPEVVAQKQQAAFGVVDDVDDVVGGEVLQDRHDDRSVGDRGDVGDAPAGVVAAYERDLVALLDACFLEQQMQLGDLLGHLVV